MSTIQIPYPSLVLLIGPAGAGKTTFALKHFLETEVVSSDRCRAMIIDDEADQRVSAQAFSVLRQITRYRLQNRRLTVIDATNLERSSRRSILTLAEVAQLPTVAILFDVGMDALKANNRKRSERVVPDSIIESQFAALQLARTQLSREGYAFSYELDATTIATAEVERRPSGSPEASGEELSGA
ncbi:MAG: AAA family ATPase [Acidobacteriota bacterium]